MPTTTTSFGRSAWRAWNRSATVSLWTPGSRWVSCATTPTAAASMPVTRTATTCGPWAWPASRSRLSGRATALPPAGEVAVAGADEDGAVAGHVADRHRAGADRRARPRAGVGRPPGRAGDGRGVFLAVRAEAPAVVAAPELALGRLALRDRRGARTAPRRSAVQRRTAQEDVGEAVRRLGLAHLEDAAVEGGGLRPAAVEGGRERDGAAARVEHRADRDRGAGGERREARRAGCLHADGAGDRRDDDRAAERRGGRGGRRSGRLPGRQRGGHGPRGHRRRHRRHPRGREGLVGAEVRLARAARVEREEAVVVDGRRRQAGQRGGHV